MAATSQSKIERKRASFRRWYDRNRRAETPRIAPASDRFWRYVLPVPEAGCWLWTGSWTSGYGQFSLATGESPVLAHRFSWEHHVGPVPEGMYVCHKCDTRSCVNPDHLFVGTQKDNMRDASRKDRIRGAYARRLSDSAVAEIIQTFAPGRGSKTNSVKLGEKFGVSSTAILNVLRQSAMTRNGRVPTADEVRASFNPHRQDEAAAARGALAGGDFYSDGE